MSLINEALKKAQRQRMEDSPAAAAPAPAGTPPPTNTAGPRVAKRRPPMAARLQIVLIGGGVALLAMGGVLAFVFLAPEDPAPAPVARSTPAPAPVEIKRPVHEPIPTPAASTPPAAAATPAPTAPAPASAPVPAPVPSAPVVSAPPPAVAVQVPPPAPVAPLPAAPSAPPRPVANPKVYEFLETLRISGIRPSPTDPKVIMNDRVYRLNDLVDRPTQLRLIRVDGSTLTFVDGTGYEYQKTF